MTKKKNIYLIRIFKKSILTLLYENKLECLYTQCIRGSQYKVFISKVTISSVVVSNTAQKKFYEIWQRCHFKQTLFCQKGGERSECNSHSLFWPNASIRICNSLPYPVDQRPDSQHFIFFVTNEWTDKLEHSFPASLFSAIFVSVAYLSEALPL